MPLLTDSEPSRSEKLCQRHMQVSTICYNLAEDLWIRFVGLLLTEATLHLIGCLLLLQGRGGAQSVCSHHQQAQRQGPE